MRGQTSRIFLALALFGAAAWALGCGSSSSSSSSGSQNNSGGGSTSNVQPIAVNFGPLGASFGYADAAFTSVTVCSPGSTTNCQTISGVLVDTGSFGLRILSSALTISLPQQTDGSGNPIVECAPFASGVTWGPVQTADIKITGEAASSIPIQVIGSSNFANPATSCTSPNGFMDNLASLGSNGILGLGQSIQDCGTGCAGSGQNPGLYYSCPTSTSCTVTTESLAMQVQNPVASFATDNNGVIVELPAVSSVQATLNGSLIFGIGTQSNNGLKGETVFGTDNMGDFQTTYNGTSYQSFLDSGSNGILFLDSTTLGIPICSDVTFLYCPATMQNVSVTNNAQPGTNGASGPATITVANADDLIKEGENAAINDLVGPLSGQVDFGLPFFFGRNVYTAIVGKSTPGGTGPYTAY
jgi:hypothetical protein